MKFDTVIIGGGLSGLTAGIELAGNGKRVAIISTGQSSLHFSSGSFELLGYDAQGRAVTDPLEAMASLPADHPYSRIGTDTVASYLPRMRGLLEQAGLGVTGSTDRNHWRLSPVGVFKTAWLTIEDYVTADSLDSMPWRTAMIVNLRGFLDFFPRFIAAGLAPWGIDCSMASVTVAALEQQRASSTEMRATNIARVLHGEAVDALADEINGVCGNADVVLMPAVAGFDDFEAARRLRSLVRRPLRFVATMGTSVPGVRAQIMLQKHFRHLGGAYMLGDTVIRGHYDSHRLQAVETVNFGSDMLEADNYIFAAGTFFSHGLTATPDGVLEPVLGLDVNVPADRAAWFDKDIFKPQPFMSFGVATTGDDFHAMRDGRPVDNVQVVGSALAGGDYMRQGAGAGIAMTTALKASQSILQL